MDVVPEGDLETTEAILKNAKADRWLFTAYSTLSLLALMNGNRHSWVRMSMLPAIICGII
ncbi:MAG: hypothetical protein ACLUDU_04490 [Butyricimonas faecihominis]